MDGGSIGPMQSIFSTWNGRSTRVIGVIGKWVESATDIRYKFEYIVAHLVSYTAARVVTIA